MELEVRYLLDDLPDGLGTGSRIRQGYICRDDRSAVRIRERDDVHVLTVKGKPPGAKEASLAKIEVEPSISADDFEALWTLTVGRRIEKVRHVVPLDGREAEIDVFGGDLEGLMIVEVEFREDDAAQAEAAAEAFRRDPPGWFGKDITGIEAWSNVRLAEFGRPDRRTVAP